MRCISLLGLAFAFLLGAFGCSDSKPEEPPTVKQRMDVQKEKKQKSYMTE
jgi:hypothetical protein